VVTTRQFLPYQHLKRQRQDEQHVFEAHDETAVGPSIQSFTVQLATDAVADTHHFIEA